MLKRSLTATVLAALLVATSVTCDLFNPHATTRFDTGSNVRDVFVYKDTLLVAADTWLLAYDVAKPKAPSIQWLVNLGRECGCVIARDGAAYVGTDSGVTICPLSHGVLDTLYCGGTSQVVTGLAVDSIRLYAATPDGITVFRLAAPDSVRFVPLAGEPTGLARHDSRLFVSLRDWGVRVFNILPDDSLVLDTMQLGRHNRAEGVTASPGGYCIISQGDSGIVVLYSPSPDTIRTEGSAGGGPPTYATAATDGVQRVSIYGADSSTVRIYGVIDKPDTFSFSEEGGFAEFTGFTRRICLGGNGYVYTASGEAGVYIIRQ